MAKFNFRGLLPAVFTPFNEDLSLNTKIIPQYAEFLANAGMKGILINATTSESVSLNTEERITLAEEWHKAVKMTKQHLMVHIGGCAVIETLKLAKHAEKLGVDSLLTLPPLYFKPKTVKELIGFLKLVSAAAPNTPLLYYHTPLNSGVDLNMEQFLKESVGQIPTLAGIKYASTDIEGAYNALRAHDKYTVFTSKDAALTAHFALGYDSACLTTLTIFPQYSVQILEAMQKSNLAEAQRVQEILREACRIITKDGAWVPAMKAAMNILTPIKVGLARPPLQNLTQDEYTRLEKSLNSLFATN